MDIPQKVVDYLICPLTMSNSGLQHWLRVTESARKNFGGAPIATC